MTRAQQASRLARRLRVYSSDCWPRERLLSVNPHPGGVLRWTLFEVLRLRDRPLGEVQLRRILLDHPDRSFDVTG
jgi:hypothetical protein